MSMRRTGPGAVDALEAVNIAKQRRSRNAAATGRGWDVGTLRSSDIGSNDRGRRSRTPSSWGTRSSLRATSRWRSRGTARSRCSPFGIQPADRVELTVDLDLQIFDSRGNQVGYSGSWDNSYEIAEFDGKPGETYTIKIRRWSGTDDVSGTVSPGR